MASLTAHTAVNYDHGKWRPHLNCVMASLSKYFCSVLNIIVLRINYTDHGTTNSLYIYTIYNTIVLYTASHAHFLYYILIDLDWIGVANNVASETQGAELDTFLPARLCCCQNDQYWAFSRVYIPQSISKIYYKSRSMWLRALLKSSQPHLPVGFSPTIWGTVSFSVDRHSSAPTGSSWHDY